MSCETQKYLSYNTDLSPRDFCLCFLLKKSRKEVQLGREGRTWCLKMVSRTTVGIPPVSNIEIGTSVKLISEYPNR